MIQAGDDPADLSWLPCATSSRRNASLVERGGNSRHRSASGHQRLEVHRGPSVPMPF